MPKEMCGFVEQLSMLLMSGMVWVGRAKGTAVQSGWEPHLTRTAKGMHKLSLGFKKSVVSLKHVISKIKDKVSKAEFTFPAS